MPALRDRYQRYKARAGSWRQDCLIMQQVTIGQLAEQGAPDIGAHVYIGAGAKVLGRVVVGDRARIGANAVVLADCTAVGIPARISAKDSQGGG